MNTSEKPRPPGTPTFSPEARLGTGVTIAGLGFLGLLLAWAEKMRSVPQVATCWFVLGVILMIFGCMLAFSGRAKSKSNQ